MLNTGLLSTCKRQLSLMHECVFFRLFFVCFRFFFYHIFCLFWSSFVSVFFSLLRLWCFVYVVVGIIISLFWLDFFFFSFVSLFCLIYFLLHIFICLSLLPSLLFTSCISYVFFTLIVIIIHLLIYFWRSNCLIFKLFL